MCLSGTITCMYMSPSKYSYSEYYLNLQYAAKKVTFCNCNYKATTELCSITTIRRMQNYNSYYRKLQLLLHKITMRTVQNYSS